MAVKNDLCATLGNLLKKSRKCVLQEKQQQFEREVAEDISLLVVRLSKATKVYCDGHWQTIEQDWEQLRAMATAWERKARVRELANPASPEVFQANLYWMDARGTHDDLKLLRRLRKNLPHNISDEFLPLLDLVMQHIHERVRPGDHSSVTALQQGEEAYQRHKDVWDRQYAGQYIAIYQGEVIDADADKTKLTEKLFKKQRETGPFRAYVMQVENPLLLAEEIHDLQDYLAGIPESLRESGAFAVYRARLERLQQRLARLQPEQHTQPNEA